MRDTHQEHHVDDVTVYDNVRSTLKNGTDVDMELDFAAFWTFFDKFVPCVAGVKVWSIKEKQSPKVGASPSRMRPSLKWHSKTIGDVGSTNKPPSGLTRSVETNSIWVGVMKLMNAMMTFAGVSGSSGELKAPRPSNISLGLRHAMTMPMVGL